MDFVSFVDELIYAFSINREYLSSLIGLVGIDSLYLVYKYYDRFYSRFNRINDTSIVKEAPKVYINNQKMELDRICDKKHCSKIIKFANTLTRVFPKDELNNYYNNVNTLKVHKNNKALDKLYNSFGLGGFYTPKYNSIYIIKEKDHIITHELLHMSSSCKDKVNQFSGFHQVIKSKKVFGKYQIGFGINEGYTQLLNERYFDINHEGDLTGYYYLVFVVKQLEDIIGQKNMEGYYLNSNLLGLINSLKEYASEEEIMKFIHEMDFLNNYCTYKIVPNRKEKLAKTVYSINKFLNKIKTNKLQQLVDLGYISYNDMEQELKAYNRLLQYKIIGNNNYYIINNATESSVYNFLDKKRLLKKQKTQA